MQHSLGFTSLLPLSPLLKFIRLQLIQIHRQARARAPTLHHRRSSHRLPFSLRRKPETGERRGGRRRGTGFRASSISTSVAMASSLLRACCAPATAAAPAVAQPPRSATANARLSQLSWSGRVAVPLQNVNSGVRVSRRQERVVVAMVLPAGDMAVEAPKVNWEARAVKSFSMAELEARKLKYPNTGTESLLLGILTEGTSEAARYLRRNGVTLFGTKEEIIKQLGKADMYFFSPEHPPLTSSAQKALAYAADPKNIPEGVTSEELSTTMIVLGIWAQKGSAGQKVLEALGINDEKIAELAATMKNSPAKRGNYQQLV